MGIGFDLNGDGEVDRHEEYISYNIWQKTVEDDQKSNVEKQETQADGLDFDNTNNCDAQKTKGVSISTLIIIIGSILALLQVLLLD